MKYRYKEFIFDDIENKVCGFCNNSLILFYNKINKYTTIKGCSNVNCIVNLGKKKEKIKYLIPNEDYEKYIKYLNYANRCKSNLTIEYWLKRGFSENESKEKISLIQKKNSDKCTKKKKENPENYNIHKLKYWLNKGYSEEEALQKIKNVKESYRSYLQVLYWLEQGYSEEEAKTIIKKIQSKNGIKAGKRRKENPERYCDINTNQLKYWLKQGLSEEEANQKVKERQRVGALDKFIERCPDNLLNLD